MIINYDVDGVFADLDSHFVNCFNCHPRETEEDHFWELVDAKEDFFATIPVFQGALEFYLEFCMFHHVFLTACPRSNYRRVALQKRAWIRTHINPHATVLPVMGGKNKSLFMHNPGDILIDDFEKNTRAWTADGGRAILHRNWDDTRRELKELLGVR